MVPTIDCVVKLYKVRLANYSLSAAEICYFTALTSVIIYVASLCPDNK